MVTPLRTLAVSSSMALVATSALAAASDEAQIDVTADWGAELSPELERDLDVAVSKADVRQAVNEVFSVLTEGMSEDGTLLSDQMFPSADGREIRFKELQLARSADHTNSSTGGWGGFQYDCYRNCHGACHGACHGSRGWR
ncbi:MAG: hypothetical protein Alpg2KO_28370 [Alphaproteobacteria bacterium]